MPSHTPNDASSPATENYTEKLWPNLGGWVIVLLLAAASVLVFIPIGNLAGLIAFIVVLAGLSIVLVTSTPTISVDAETLRVGRAQIERKYVGAVSIYGGEAAFEQRGPKLNGLAYLCIRGWIKPVVKIEITDPADPTPYWLTSSRNPEYLAAALGGASEITSDAK